MPRSKAVVMKNVTTGAELEFKSGADAARANNMDPVHVSRMCREGISFNGHTARFKESNGVQETPAQEVAQAQ